MEKKRFRRRTKKSDPAKLADDASKAKFDFTFDYFHILICLFALFDIFFTLKGVNGDIAIEGNPIMRYMMANFGLMGGLVVEKSLVLLLATTVAIVSVIGIEKEADWVYYLAFTRVTRNWMKRKKRYWVAFLPLYFVAFSLGVAAASWVYLIAEMTYS